MTGTTTTSATQRLRGLLGRLKTNGTGWAGSEEDRALSQAIDYIEGTARLLKDGEETPEHPDGYDMASDDAVDTVATLVNDARRLVYGEVGRG